MSDFFDPIYKGCLAPPTILGVPLIPFVVVGILFAQVSLLLFYFFSFALALIPMILGFFVYWWARHISRSDEHRLLQYMLKMQIWNKQHQSRKFWGAYSFSPHRPRTQEKK